MIRFLHSLMIGSALAATLSSASASVNIFQNGDFEDRERGLYPSYQDRIFQFEVGDWVSTPDRSSILPGPFNPGEASAMAPGNTELRQDFFNFTTDIEGISEDVSDSGAATFGGPVTQISFWAAHPDAPASRIFVTLFYDDESRIERTYQTTTGGWEYFDITPQHDPERELIAISFFGNRAGRTFLDDVQVLVLVPEPGAVSLLMLTLGALLFFRRRSR